MGSSIIDALEITTPDGPVDVIKDPQDKTIWERCEIRDMEFDGPVVVPNDARRGRITMIGGKSFKWNQLVKYTPSTYASRLTSYTIEDGVIEYVVPDGWSNNNAIYSANFSDFASATDKVYVRHTYDAASIGIRVFRVGSTGADVLTGNGVFEKIYTAGSYPRVSIRVEPNATGESVTCRISTVALNLTAIFGAGNEPSTVDAVVNALGKFGIDITQPQPYEKGSIKHTAVDGIVVSGRNLLNYNRDNREQYIEDEPVDRSATNNPYYGVALRNLSAGAYTVYFDFDHEPTSNIYIYCRFKDAQGTTLVTKNLIAGKTSGLGNGVTQTTSTVPEGGSIFIYNAVGTSKATAVSTFGILAYLGVTRNGIEYVPYRAPVSRSIPSTVLALNGYGWSAGAASNKIIRHGDKWVYRQEVESTTFDGSEDENIGLYAAKPGFILQNLPGLLADGRVDGLCNQYQTSKSSAENSSAVWFGVAGNNWLYCVNNPYRDDSVSDGGVANFKAHLATSPLVVYYPIAAPIETDITDLMGDALDDWVTCLEGDTIEFTSQSGAYVPTKVQFYKRFGALEWGDIEIVDDSIDRVKVAPGNYHAYWTMTGLPEYPDLMPTNWRDLTAWTAQHASSSSTKYYDVPMQTTSKGLVQNIIGLDLPTPRVGHYTFEFPSLQYRRLFGEYFPGYDCYARLCRQWKDTLVCSSNATMAQPTYAAANSRHLYDLNVSTSDLPNNMSYILLQYPVGQEDAFQQLLNELKPARWLYNAIPTARVICSNGTTRTFNGSSTTRSVFAALYGTLGYDSTRQWSGSRWLSQNVDTLSWEKYENIWRAKYDSAAVQHINYDEPIPYFINNTQFVVDYARIDTSGTWYDGEMWVQDGYMYFNPAASTNVTTVDELVAYLTSLSARSLAIRRSTINFAKSTGTNYFGIVHTGDTFEAVTTASTPAPADTCFTIVYSTHQLDTTSAMSLSLDDELDDIVDNNQTEPEQDDDIGTEGEEYEET